MKLTEYQSKWGNHYRSRYYINGRRVSKTAFEIEFNTHNADALTPTHENLYPDWRYTWTIEP